MRVLILLLGLFALPVSAQVVVKSGEHGAFTRLVLQLDRGGDLSFGRTHSGYELSINGGNPTFDLSRVFQLIDHQRLKSIWADPKTGNLLLGIGCDCHAQLQVSANGLAVIDIQDGPAPSDSDFEVSLAGTSFPPLGATPTPRPRMRPSQPSAAAYDWTTAKKTEEPGNPLQPQETALISSIQLQGLRHQLTARLDAAGASGLIELRPADYPAPAQQDPDRLANPNMNIGPAPSLSADGQLCRPNEDVALPEWHEEGNPAEILARSRKTILGEFDLVNQDGLLAAVRTHLYFGFGAEARNLAKNFGLAAESADLLAAMSFILDGLPLDHNPFADQIGCKGPIALWALAALPAKTQAKYVDSDSVVQAFMALPAQLQRILAPDLSAKLIAAKEIKSAEIIAATLSRAQPEHDDTLAVVDAEISLSKDNLDKAEAHIGTVTAHTNLKAIGLKAETAFRQKKPLGVDFLTEIEALYFVEAHGPDGPQLGRAVALTRALEGDFKSAFGVAELDPGTVQDLWGHLAEEGGDGILLDLAAQVSAEARNRVLPPVRTAIFDRLLSLGLPALAKDWIGTNDLSADRMARLALSNHDGRSVLDLLGSTVDPESTALRQEALATLGLHEELAYLLDTSGQSDQALRVRRWMGQWQESSTSKTDPWSRLARSATRESAASPEPSLALSENLLNGSAEDMKDIRLLLEETAMN